MKIVIAIFLFLSIAAMAQDFILSTSIEPALNAPARFGVYVAGAVNVTENNAFSLRVGTGRTLTPGYARCLLEFYPGVTLIGDVQAGVTRDRGEARGMVLYGVAVATDLSRGNTGYGFSVTYGLHVNKIADRPMYPSGYVSLGYTFGRFKWRWR